MPDDALTSALTKLSGPSSAPRTVTVPQTASHGAGLEQALWGLVTPSAPAKRAHDPTFFGKAIAGMQYAANSPVARGMDAVLNATSRMGTAAVAGRNPITQGLLDPASATDTTHAAETNVFHNALHIPNLPESAWQGPGGVALRVGQALLDFTTETGLDVGTYVPGLNAYTIGSRLLGRLTRAARTIEGVDRAFAPADRFIDKFKTHFVEGHDLRKAVTRAGEDIVKGHETYGHDLTRADEQRYVDLIEKHRPELESIEEQRKTLDARINELKPLVESLPETAPVHPNLAAAQQQYNDLLKEREELRLPQEIEQANLQRAYREGTYKVRRQAIKAGYRPTPEERAHPPLNILHNLKGNYEPAQHVYSEAELAQTANMGPLRYTGQGNRKAGFDLPQHGPNMDDPLADRLLDRLVRGARLEHYHAARRNTLTDLGLMPTTSRETQVMEGYERAIESGDTKAAARYEALISRQSAALAQQEAKQAATLKPDAMAAPQEQKLEVLDPLTAKLRSVTDVETALGVDARSRARDTRFAEGRYAGGKQVGTYVNRAEDIANKAAGRTKKLSVQARARAEAAAAQLYGQAARAKGVMAQRIARLLPREASGLVDESGHPIGQSFAAPREASTLLGPSGEVVSRISPAQRKYEEAMKPIENLTEKIKERTEQTPEFERLANPSKAVAEAVGEQASKARGRVAKYGARVDSEAARNDAIKTIADRAEDLTSRTNVIEMPPHLKARLFGAKASYERSLLGEFSDLQRDALFVIPWAHMKNITVLALLGKGGHAVVADGMGIYQKLKKNPSAFADEIKEVEQAGASSHYLRDVEPGIAGALRQFGGETGAKAASGVENILKRSNQSLENYDTAMRIAMMRHLKRQGITGFQAGGMIRDALGDYRNVAPFIAELRARFGANFPAWRLGIVPRAVSNALQNNPRALKTYARLERLFSDDVSYPLIGADIDLGGPVEDYGRMILPKPSWSNFYTSEATIGPARAAVDLGMAAERGQLGTELETQALRLTPGGYIASQAANLPYPSTVPTALRTVAGLGGAYFPSRPSLRQRVTQLRRLGLPSNEVRAILHVEGYYGPAGSNVRPAPGAQTAPSNSLDALRNAMQSGQ